MTPVTINRKWTLLLPEHRARGDWWDTWEQERLASMHEHLMPNDRVAYVGAEQGDMPALCASWGCRVTMIEPTKWVWPNIRNIFVANGLWTPDASFVGFAGDTDRDVDGNLVWGWPLEAWGKQTDVEGFTNLCERPDIPVVTLNTLTDRMGPFDAVSIDVEGSELHVLQGAAATLLTNYRPLVWVSIHPDFMRDMYGHHPDDVHTLMEAHGYRGEMLADVHEQHWYFRPVER